MQATHCIFSSVIGSTLRHPNVVSLLGACAKAPTLCIVTEFMTRKLLPVLVGRHVVVQLQEELEARQVDSAVFGCGSAVFLVLCRLLYTFRYTLLFSLQAGPCFMSCT